VRADDDSAMPFCLEIRCLILFSLKKKTCPLRVYDPGAAAINVDEPDLL
jgi:hypothetical protein